MAEEMELAPSEYYALLRSDLYSFMVLCFKLLYPGTEFMPNWHLEVIAAKLTDCISGKISGSSSTFRRALSSRSWPRSRCLLSILAAIRPLI